MVGLQEVVVLCEEEPRLREAPLLHRGHLNLGAGQEGLVLQQPPARLCSHHLVPPGLRCRVRLAWSSLLRFFKARGTEDSSTCKSRMHWVKNHVFGGHENSCNLAYSKAKGLFSRCAPCLSGAGGLRRLPRLHDPGRRLRYPGRCDLSGLRLQRRAEQLLQAAFPMLRSQL